MSSAAILVETRSSRAGTLMVALLGMLIAQIDTSVANLATPVIGRDLGAGVGQLQWVIDGFNLVYGGLLLTGGTLGDLYGRRRIFVIGIGLFCLGSIACAMAPNAAWLIGGRMVAGVGAALDVPLTLAFLSVAYPDPKERAHAVGLWAAANGLAFVIGPTLGGFLVETLGWRSIFWLVVPLGALAWILAIRSIEESKGEQDRKLDLPGQVLLIGALGTFTLAAIEGHGWGWLSWPTLVCIGAAPVLLAGLIAVERGKETGLVPLRFFAIRKFSGGLVVTAAMTFGMYGMFFIAPIYLQNIRGASAFTAGLEMLPMPIAFFLLSQRSGHLAHKLGIRAMLIIGMGCMGAGVIALSFLQQATPLGWIEAAFVVAGIGLGFNTGPVLNMVVVALPKDRAGTGSGLANTARLTGATLGVAILGAILASHQVAGVDAAQFMAGMSAALKTGGVVLWLGGIAAAAIARD